MRNKINLEKSQLELQLLRVKKVYVLRARKIKAKARQGDYTSQPNNN